MESAKEVEGFLQRVFPQVAPRLSVLEASADHAVVTMVAADQDLRPGGTVSGPTLFMLADVVFYVAVLAGTKGDALAVTTNANIDFLRKPLPGLLRAEARVLKRGRALVVGDALIKSAGAGPAPVARASLTYSIPPGPRQPLGLQPSPAARERDSALAVQHKGGALGG